MKLTEDQKLALFSLAKMVRLGKNNEMHPKDCENCKYASGQCSFVEGDDQYLFASGDLIRFIESL